MRVEDVVDRESLEAYLDALPEGKQRSLYRRLAFRSAARVLPLAARNAFLLNSKPYHSFSPLIVFGCLSILGFIQSLARIDGRHAYAASDLESAYTDMSYSASKVSDAKSYAAAEAAGKASYYAVRSAFGSEKGSAVEAVCAAADATHSAVIWSHVQADLSGKTGPIWHDGVPSEIDSAWGEAIGAMKTHPADWSFWITWYERVVEGRDWLSDAVGDLLLTIEKRDWGKGPEHINPMFDEVLALYRAEDFQLSHSYGFRAKLNRKKDRLDLEAVEPADLTEIVKAMRSALSDFKRRSNRGTSHNQLNALCYDTLAPDIADFRKVISKHKDDPQALHDEILRYEKYFVRVLQDRELPQAAEVAGLIDDMRTAQTGICLISEPVRETVRMRTAMAVEKATEAQKVQAIRNCLGMLTDGTGEMELFAALSVKALVDPESSSEEKQMAWQFAYRMGANAVTTIKRYEDEVGADKTDLGKRMKDISDFAVAGDKFVDVVQEAVAEGRPWVEGFLQDIGQNNFPGIMT